MTYYTRHANDKSLKGERKMTKKTMKKKMKTGKKVFNAKKFAKTKAQVFGMKEDAGKM